MQLVFLTILSPTTLQAQEDILIARQRPLGSVVTIQGIVLNGAELGVVRYLQDTTAGIAVYPGGSSPSSFTQVVTGDAVQVTGVLSLYHGLLEINPILSYQKISSSNPLPEAVDRRVEGLTYLDQGRLVLVRCMMFKDAPGHFEAGSQRIYSTDAMKSDVYLEYSSPLINTPLPASSVDLVAIASYFDASRLLVRSASDIVTTECFSILPTPTQSGISQSGFSLEWNSSDTGKGFCRVRDEAGVTVAFDMQDTSETHAIELTQLQPASFYIVEAGAVNSIGDSAIFPAIPMSTKSSSSGAIEVYFNHNVDASFSNGSVPDGASYNAMLASVTNVIKNAQNTLDVAMYNSNRADIITTLEQAIARGVRVRYIADGGQSNSSLDPLPDFPVLFRNGDGIMHDKFIIADPQDPDLAVVWTGSTNHSTGQLSSDPNNTVVIHDQALAKVYLYEFEEMWGGGGDFPNPQLSRTGSSKIDDTPHLFQIGDRSVECYFSPSDNTNREILTELVSAEESIDAALLLLTRNDLASAMGAHVGQGDRIRVIVDDLESSYTPIQTLLVAGALTAHHDFGSIFHHKYAVIDEGTANARVITGSHNWTTSATTINDENTLIIHDVDIANLYRQEFEARWSEVYITGSNSIASATMVRIFPNPAEDKIWIETEAPIAQITIQTVTGIDVYRGSTPEASIDLNQLAQGMYLLRVLMADGSIIQLPFIKV